MLMKYATALTVLLALVANPAYSGEPLTEARQKALTERIDAFNEKIRSIGSATIIPFSEFKDLTVLELQDLISKEIKNAIVAAGNELLGELTTKERTDLEDAPFDLMDPRSVIREISFKINLYKHDIYSQDRVLSAISHLIRDYHQHTDKGTPWYERFALANIYTRAVETYQILHENEEEELEEKIRTNGSERGRN